MESNNNPYDMILWPVLGIILLVALSFAYDHFRGPINKVIMTVNDVQLAVIEKIPGADEAGVVREKLKHRNPSSFTFHNMVAQVRYVGTYLRWPVAGAVLFLAFLSWRMGLNYRKVLSMKTLVQHNVEVFPHLAPVAWRDIEKEPLDSGPWAVSRQPLQWAVENKLLLDEKNEPIKKEVVLTKWGIANLKSPLLKPGKNRGVHLDKAKTEEEMKKHLGAPFSGTDKIPDYQKGLAAAFMAFGAGDKGTAFEFIDQMALSFVEKGRDRKDPAKADPSQEMEIDIEGADELIEKYGKNEELQEALVIHNAFVNTWFHALIEFARINGVLECSRFIWLKPTDRTLWYVLNHAGRRTAWSEAAGEFAHYQAETALDQSIDEPEIDEAVTALESALIAEGWIPEGRK